jgi:hypothetical protein
MSTPGNSTVVDLVPITQTTSLYKARAEAIQVTDQESYITAGSLVVELRTYVKDVKAKLGPGIDSAKKHLDFLRNQQLQYTAPIETIISIAERKAEAWIAEDRRIRAAEEQEEQQKLLDAQKAKAEADRLQAEAEAAEKKAARVEEIRAMLRRKSITKREAERLLKLAGANEEAALAAAAAAAEEAANAPPPTVRVASAVPTVSGIKKRVNWKFEVVDASKLPRQFLMPDLVAIGTEVRKIKHIKRAEALIPGIKVREEDSI